MGWSPGCHWSGERIEGYWRNEEFATELPNYYESVRSFNQIEASLSGKNKQAYVKKLVELSKSESNLIFTTHEQRVNALGIILKLWK